MQNKLDNSNNGHKGLAIVSAQLQGPNPVPKSPIIRRKLSQSTADLKEALAYLFRLYKGFNFHSFNIN